MRRYRESRCYHCVLCTLERLESKPICHWNQGVTDLMENAVNGVESSPVSLKANVWCLLYLPTRGSPTEWDITFKGVQWHIKVHWKLTVLSTPCQNFVSHGRNGLITIDNDCWMRLWFLQGYLSKKIIEIIKNKSHVSAAIEMIFIIILHAHGICVHDSEVVLNNERGFSNDLRYEWPLLYLTLHFIQIYISTKLVKQKLESPCPSVRQSIYLSVGGIISGA